ncbi:protein translocase subunit SecF [candidate division KSB1 bacterium]|jgi:preprotein translocase subunit SecF|nr:protein translocase subunit SecF [candidate division KSB1 bacterium]
MQFFRETNINFTGQRRYAYIFSAILILIGLISLLFHGGIEYSIDFTGGTSLQVAFEKPIDAGQIRNAIADIGFGNAEIKQIGLDSENQFIIRVEQMEEGADIATTLENELTKDISENPYDIRAVTEIGPKIGGELRQAAMMAILFALLGILIYISWRFEFKFAVGAVIALFHDVLITLGVFSILNLEVSLAVVAAFLTIVGYSLNDTIVVFDRIRENLKVMRRETIENIFNYSLNQTLSRTVITSVTTLIVVLVLFFLGGEVIHDFSFALIIGVIIGTYSSLYVASPLVLEWQLRTDQKKIRKSSRSSR